jgi:hypothetical protein
MPRNTTTKQSIAPPPAEAVGAVKTVEELRAEAAAAEQFAKWAQSADDDEAPALLFYPKPAGKGKGVWSWKQKAVHDAQTAVATLKAAVAAEAAKPLRVPTAVAAEAAEEEDGPRYMAPPESAEVAAARAARWAAEGRTPSGVLLNQEGCSVEAPKQQRMSDEDCQRAVDLFGWHHGAELIMAQNEGYTLDDLYGAEMQAAWDAYCGAMRASEAAREAAAKAAMEANWRRACVEQAMVEARRNLRRGEAVQKNGRICTRCYSCEGNKQTDWEDGGKKARPSTLHVSSECFTHAEFLAGRIREDCPFLHHGDAGWHAEWDTNFLWDPMHPESMPAPKHIRKREGDTLLCISEKSAGYLPVHLGGKAEGMDARQWRQQAASQNRFAAVGGGGSQAAAHAPEGRFAAVGGGSSQAAGARRSGPGSGWAKK